MCHIYIYQNYKQMNIKTSPTSNANVICSTYYIQSKEETLLCNVLIHSKNEKEIDISNQRSIKQNKLNNET
jgi:hypothetical protein